MIINFRFVPISQSKLFYFLVTKKQTNESNLVLEYFFYATIILNVSIGKIYLKITDKIITPTH